MLMILFQFQVFAEAVENCCLMAKTNQLTNLLIKKRYVLLNDYDITIDNLVPNTKHLIFTQTKMAKFVI